MSTLMRILKDEGCFRENYCVGGDSASSACSPEVTRRRPRGCSKNYFKVSLMVNAAEIVEKEMKREARKKYCKRAGTEPVVVHLKIENIPAKGVRFPDFIATFTLSVGADTYFDS